MNIHAVVGLAISIWALSALANDCIDNATNQMQMSECTDNEFKRKDSELNKIYQQIQKKYQQDQVFIDKLKRAQRAWLAFRDAQLEMLYPHKEDSSYYGSSLDMCTKIELTSLTVERIKTLKRWLAAHEDNDSCSGSIESA
ncbi:MAG: lysozyme inhibitor LprI family protein [Legionella sp.]